MRRDAGCMQRPPDRADEVTPNEAAFWIQVTNWLPPPRTPQELASLIRFMLSRPDLQLRRRAKPGAASAAEPPPPRT
jgi:hypothetical protein